MKLQGLQEEHRVSHAHASEQPQRTEIHTTDMGATHLSPIHVSNGVDTDDSGTTHSNEELSGEASQYWVSLCENSETQLASSEPQDAHSDAEGSVNTTSMAPLHVLGKILAEQLPA